MDKYSANFFCPNCGRKISGYKREDGAIIVDCPRCKTHIFSRQRSKTETYIKIKLAK